jgi:ABC-type glycerol-3-phosphate transport system substrate-binding protein
MIIFQVIETIQNKKESKMKNSKLLVVLSVLLAFGMLLAACAPAATPEATTAPAGGESTEAVSSEPVTITFWHSYSADT